MRFLHDWRDLRAGKWVDLYKAFEGVTAERFESDPSEGTQIGNRWLVLYQPDEPDQALLGSGGDRHPSNITVKGRYQIDANSISDTE
ncbi:hypothetical protein KK103_06865 [Curtobacterium flaccumfaciens pv. flaccumfaciens]|uniref:Uncharacterized protein n=1 Tax=Curtobacterium flaccumfaciens pv. flaccumfaciens TaxID=138532 RepID=A0A9Q2ZNY0_9MICO|nr:hypothetical protein [Curtobacterium flaccumfaciens]MBT1541478.1 hypothetical protein [Curtobacterium flaccumfaciens pv. flaccumfaciens]